MKYTNFLLQKNCRREEKGRAESKETYPPYKHRIEFGSV